MNNQAAKAAQLPPPAAPASPERTGVPPGRTRVPLLLVADPDEKLGRELVLALAERGVEVTVCPDGAQALLSAGALHPDVVLISAALPAVDAVTFVTAIRNRSTIPVIIGVGTDDADHAIKALAAGANVCVARPYRLPELLPLIQGIGTDGPAGEAGAAVLSVGAIELDRAAHVVRLHGKPIHLPLREFELLHYLMIHADQVVSRQQIQAHVWRSDKVITNTISVRIRRLREKLGDDQDNPAIILTVRGLGYRLTAPQ